MVALLKFIIFFTYYTILVSGKYKYHEHDWSYDPKGEYGPPNWYKKYPTCGSQMRQSPIAIWPKDMDNANCEVNQTHWLQFFQYETHLKDLVISNNGHSIMIKIPHEHGLMLSSSFLHSTYVLDQLHFHWGTTGRNGSEHRFARHSYPFEMHFVHFNTKSKEPATEPGGIAVVGVFFEFGTNVTSNQEVHKIVSKLVDVQHEGQKSTLKSLTLMNLLPQNRDKVLRYNGSLTTPPCNEVVDWIIFPEPGIIDRQDFIAFSNLLKDMTNGFGNFRPTQPLNGRKITFYTNLRNDISLSEPIDPLHSRKGEFKTMESKGNRLLRNFVSFQLCSLILLINFCLFFS